MNDFSYIINTFTVKLLVADDFPFNIMIIKNFLSRLADVEFKITEACNGRIALNEFI
jgi:hypothetical protein